MSRIRYGQIISRFIDRPLAIHPRNAAIVWNAVCGRFGASPADLPEIDAAVVDSRLDRMKASRFEGEMVEGERGKFPRVEPFMVKDGVAIISVTGELVNRGGWVGSYSGVTSYEGIGFQLKRAAASSKVSAILLDVESPGGEAVGMIELASLVRAVNAVKPVYASVNGMAASAAYGMVSGARQIVIGPSGIAGSIGVVLLHADYSEALSMEGIKPTLIFAGAHKVDGNPYESLSEPVAASLQAEVNTFYKSFCDAVAAGRGRRLSAKAARETEARCYIGQEAVGVGVADAVGTFDEVLTELTARVKRQAAKRPSGAQGSKAMAPVLDNDEDMVSAAEATRRADAARTEGHQAGVAEGTKAANERFAAIAKLEGFAENAGFVMTLATENPTMSAESIGKCLAAMPARITVEGKAGEGAKNVVSIHDVAAGVRDSGANDVASGQAAGGDATADKDSGWGGIVSSHKEKRAGQRRR